MSTLTGEQLDLINHLRTTAGRKEVSMEVATIMLERLSQEERDKIMEVLNRASVTPK